MNQRAALSIGLLLVVAALVGCVTVPLAPAQAEHLSRLQALADPSARNVRVVAGWVPNELGWLRETGIAPFWTWWQLTIRPEALESDCADLVVMQLLNSRQIALAGVIAVWAYRHQAAKDATSDLSERGWSAERLRGASEICATLKASLPKDEGPRPLEYRR